MGEERGVDLGPNVCWHELGRLIFIQARDGAIDTPQPRQGGHEKRVWDCRKIQAIGTKCGYFWSCHQRTEDGSFCSYKPEGR